MAASLLSRLLDFGFALVYLRVLQADGTAVYQFLVVLVTYLDTVVNFGLNTILAREVARAPSTARAAFRAVALVRLGLWLAALPIVFGVLGPGLDLAGLPPSAAPAGWLFFLALLPGILATTATGIFWAAERLEIPAVLSIVTTLAKIGLGVLVLMLGQGLVGLAASSVLVNILTAVLLMRLLLRLPLMSASAASSERAFAVRPRHLLSESWPLFVNQLLAGLFFKIDSLLLPGLAGVRAAGVYAAAYKVVDGVGVISSSFTFAVFPRLARRAESSADALAYAYRLSLRLLLQAAFPMAAAIAILAGPIMELVAGSDFLPSAAIALAVLIWFLPFSYANGLTQYALIAAGRQRILTLAFLGALAFNLSANFLLIPRYGFVGAAVVTVLSELALMLPFSWAARKALPGVSLLREGAAAAAATALMAPVVWWTRDALGLAPAAMIGLVVYLAALWAIGGIAPEQWALLRTLAGRRPATAS